jgi:hypothetical protein
VGHAIYHSAVNAINNDHAINNIKQMLIHKLSKFEVANNSNCQSTQLMFATFSQQIAMLTGGSTNLDIPWLLAMAMGTHIVPGLSQKIGPCNYYQISGK